ncbi:hypothetical protein D3C79_140280 [compost metagenome]
MYKYFPPERIDVLVNNLICFSNPRNFNDPFEFYSLFDFKNLEKYLVNLIINGKIPGVLSQEQVNAYRLLRDCEQRDFYSRIEFIAKQLISGGGCFVNNALSQSFQMLNERIIESVRVLCLTEKPDNILMWGHYAASHTGFALELDTGHKFFNQRRSEKDEHGYLRKVIYQENIEVIDPTEIKGFDVKHFIVKSKDWQYEQEWRMLLPEGLAAKKVENSNIVYDLFDIPAEAIKSLIIGCRASGEFENALKNLISLDKYKHVTLYKCHRSNERYELIINLLNER